MGLDIVGLEELCLSLCLGLQDLSKLSSTLELAVKQKIDVSQPNAKSEHGCKLKETHFLPIC